MDRDTLEYNRDRYCQTFLSIKIDDDPLMMDVFDFYIVTPFMRKGTVFFETGYISNKSEALIDD